MKQNFHLDNLRMVVSLYVYRDEFTDVITHIGKTLLKTLLQDFASCSFDVKFFDKFGSKTGNSFWFQPPKITREERFSIFGLNTNIV